MNANYLNFLEICVALKGNTASEFTTNVLALLLKVSRSTKTQHVNIFEMMTFIYNNIFNLDQFLCLKETLQVSDLP